MVLPEISRTMAYTTRNTVNRLARKELNSNPVVLELSKAKGTYTSSSRNISLIRQLYFLLTKQYEVPFITRVKRQKGQETEKKTANVQMSRTVGVV